MLSKMVITNAQGKQKVSAGLYALNIHLIIIQRKTNYIPQIHLSLKLFRLGYT